MYKYLRNSLNIFINTMYLYKGNNKLTFTFVTKIDFLHSLLATVFTINFYRILNSTFITNY